MKSELVPCPTCQKKFAQGTALKTHIRMKHSTAMATAAAMHSNGNGHTNGNGDGSKYLEVPLKNGVMLRIPTTAPGLEFASKVLAELHR
jgi:hypothetical protein